MQAWLIWIIFAAILLVAEIFTAGFFLMWFSVAAGVAGLLALAGLGLAVQWAAFVVLSVVLVIASRPLADKMAGKQPPGVGADRYIDCAGIVIEQIDPEKGTGLVRVKGDEWRAESSDGTTLPEGTKIQVIAVDGTRLVVRRKI